MALLIRIGRGKTSPAGTSVCEPLAGTRARPWAPLVNLWQKTKNLCVGVSCAFREILKSRLFFFPVSIV